MCFKWPGYGVGRRIQLISLNETIWMSEEISQKRHVQRQKNHMALFTEKFLNCCFSFLSSLSSTLKSYIFKGTPHPFPPAIFFFKSTFYFLFQEGTSFVSLYVQHVQNCVVSGLAFRLILPLFINKRFWLEKTDLCV